MRYNPMLASPMSRLPMVDVRPGEWMAASRCDQEQYPTMAFGAVVCVVRVIACLHIDNGPWCWVFARHVIRCEPIPYRGAQGLWEIELPQSVDAVASAGGSGNADHARIGFCLFESDHGTPRH
jgi:hypothetical protein